MLESLVYLVLLIFALLGLPLYLVISLIALSAFTFAGEETASVAIEMFRLASAPTLLTIPLFTLAGNMMAESKSPERLFKMADALFGWLPAGVAIVGTYCECFFYSIYRCLRGDNHSSRRFTLSNSEKEGYDERFILGILTVSGSLGLLFPPSLPIILYGLVGKVDIEQLFKAGVVPGVFLIAILAIYAILKNSRNKKRGEFNLKKIKEGIQGSLFELFLPVLVLGGIYGGIVTATEASVLTVVYVFLIEFFIYRDLSLKKHFSKITIESMSLVGSILIILCCAMGLTNYLIDEEIPMKILESMQQYLTNKYVFLLFLNIFLLVVGAMMDIFSAIIVVVPLILPIAQSFEIHPIHLAVIFLTNLEIGYITPPVGINLFISSYKFNRPITELYRVSIPFLVLLLIALAVITYVPALSLWLIKV